MFILETFHTQPSPVFLQGLFSLKAQSICVCTRLPRFTSQQSTQYMPKNA